MAHHRINLHCVPYIYSVMAFRASTCGSIPCASLLRDQIQDPATVSALSGGLAAVRAVWRQLSEMDSGLLVVCHVSFETRIGSSSLTLAMNFGVLFASTLIGFHRVQIAYLQQPNSVLGSGASMSNYYAGDRAVVESRDCDQDAPRRVPL